MRLIVAVVLLPSLLVAAEPASPQLRFENPHVRAVESTLAAGATTTVPPASLVHVLTAGTLHTGDGDLAETAARAQGDTFWSERGTPLANAGEAPVRLLVVTLKEVVPESEPEPESSSKRGSFLESLGFGGNRELDDRPPSRLHNRPR